jgi:hypothetical protein
LVNVSMLQGILVAIISNGLGPRPMYVQRHLVRDSN